MQVQKIKKGISIPFLVLSITSMVLIMCVFLWSVVDDVYEFKGNTNVQEFTYNIKEPFWICFIIANSLGTIIEIFLLTCYFLNKKSKLYHLFESTISMIDIYFLQIIWTIWSSIMTSSGVDVWIPLSMYIFITLTWILYIVRTIQNSSKTKKTLSALLLILEKSELKNKNDFEELYDEINDIKEVVKIKSKKNKKPVFVEVNKFNEKIDNAKTKKIEI